MTVTPGQFGVLGAQEKRDWPPLTLAETTAVLDNFHMGAAVETIIWHGQRPFSATGLVRLADGRAVLLKRHDRRLRDVAALTVEHRFSAHLARAGLPVARLYETKRGAGSMTVGGWVYEAFATLEGEDRYRDMPSWEPFFTPEDARAAGAMLGRLHIAANGFDAPARQGCPLVSSCGVVTQPDLIAALSRWIPAQAGLTEALRQRDWRRDIVSALTKFHARLVPLLDTIVPLWGHGDWHGSNLFWSGDTASVSGVFDFGMADRTCAAFDLAVAIERSGIAWLSLDRRDAVADDQIQAMLDGYRATRGWSAAEAALIVAFLPLVHVAFALSEVAYYDVLLRDPVSADVAYDDYLLGHARWFASDAGAAFLARLSDWTHHGLTPGILAEDGRESGSNGAFR